MVIDQKGAPSDNRPLRIGLLTGADDRTYALGLAGALVERRVYIDFIGSNDVDGPELHNSELVTFLNLRGDQSSNAPVLRKGTRITLYYLRLIMYAVRSRASVLHILWNNKFEYFDRTVLMLFYRLLGRRVVLTAHNVNRAMRDGCDSALNRLTLRIQYHLCDHVFVHSEKMRKELCSHFAVPAAHVSVIPFGINNAMPTTSLSGAEARRRLGFSQRERLMLFFGQIAPYKGLEHLVAALSIASVSDGALRLIVAGKVKKGSEDYWRGVETTIQSLDVPTRIKLHVGHVPDEDVELYFKAADVLVIPYVQIFQSGVPFLAYSFGLPVVATSVGALSQDIVEGQTGLLCRPADPLDLARAIAQYFASDLYAQLDNTRAAIRAYANDQHSWSRVGAITEAVYRRVAAMS